ncbi:hypothetical protein B0H11DRAFT_1914617 [Mycena galericulata]|nr:hypothetical protein B0H11DRAFT_1914617 [Mycena galericulata]
MACITLVVPMGPCSQGVRRTLRSGRTVETPATGHAPLKPERAYAHAHVQALMYPHVPPGLEYPYTYSGTTTTNNTFWSNQTGGQGQCAGMQRGWSSGSRGPRHVRSSGYLGAGTWRHSGRRGSASSVRSPLGAAGVARGGEGIHLGGAGRLRLGDRCFEFKNVSQWQVEALFCNSFPSTDEDNFQLMRARLVAQQKWSTQDRPCEMLGRTR